jgi:hypothetical protein
MMENIRRFESALLDLPAKAQDAIDRADPDKEAIVLGSFFTPPGEVGGRRVYGGRPDHWTALEDKIVVDDFFDRAGVERVPSAVVAVDQLDDVIRKFDRGLGAACAGDAREGFNGGAEYFYWIRTADDLREARSFYAAHCDAVRVMPFLEGVPCSIHGAVIRDTVIALRPVEMVSLRRQSSRLLYAGTATYWDPPDDDRTYMRDVARRVGVRLRDEYGYRGAFTVDGVLTAEGFRPTELNPRAGAGTGPVAAPSGVPMQLLQKVLIEGEDVDARPADLEELIVTRADAQRAGGAYTSLPGPAWPQKTHTVVRTKDAYRLAADREDADADGIFTLGASGIGRFILFAPDPKKIEVGPSFAPRAVDAFALADREFGTSIGPLEPAKPAR